MVPVRWSEARHLSLQTELQSVREGTAGVGSPSHVSGAYFQRATGTTFQFAQYRGAAPAMQDLVGGHVDLMFDQPPNSLPHVRDGNIKAYAVTSKARLASAPDIPTVDEAGLPGFYITVWSGMWAPKGTPQNVISKLNAAVVDALADKAVQRRLADLGQEVPAARSADPCSSRCLPEIRNRKVVADCQGDELATEMMCR